MKEYFPFTDYDFYAYLASGGLVVMVANFAFFDASFFKPDLPVMVVVAVFFASYAVGQIVASVSGLLIEEVITRRWIGNPVVVQLGRESGKPNPIAKLISSRHYRKLPPKILDRVRALTIATIGRGTETEEVFQFAYSEARKNADVARRLDGFLNQYGFARNFALASLVGAIMLTIALPCTGKSAAIVSIFLIVAVVMTLRFMKFYATFTAEIFRYLAFKD